MRKIRLRELSDWPPMPGGAYERGTRFPLAGEAVVTEVFPVIDRQVAFVGVSRVIRIPIITSRRMEATAQRLSEAVAANIGKTVAELGDSEIEIEDGAMKAQGSA